MAPTALNHHMQSEVGIGPTGKWPCDTGTDDSRPHPPGRKSWLRGRRKRNKRRRRKRRRRRMTRRRRRRRNRL